MSKKPESSDTFTAEQIEAVRQEIRDRGDNESYWPVMDTGLAIRLILQARAERDAAKTALETARTDRENARYDCDTALAQLEQRTAERDLRETARVLAVQERDAAVARVRAADGAIESYKEVVRRANARCADVVAIIAALEADVESWQSKAGAEHDRVKELEDALDAKSYLAAQNDEYYAQITALEAEIEQLMKTEEARAVAYGHWKQKEIDRLETENAELRKRKAHIEFDTYARDMRIAENERLRVALDKAAEHDFWGWTLTELVSQLRAALKGEGDEV